MSDEGIQPVLDKSEFALTIQGFATGQKLFGRYTLGRMIGRGGMGLVWLARDDELGEEIALKFLPEAVQMDATALEELKRETRRSRKLAHPNIVKVFDFVSDGAAAAISMEFVNGDTLSGLRSRQANLCFEVPALEDWTKQLLNALIYAHEDARVVHRDLKPANIMVDGAGRIKVTDFGIASSISENMSRVTIQRGSSGTLIYMSPQQAMGNTPSVQDDIYALGATLYELISGKPPFYRGDILSQVWEIVPSSMAQRRLELEIEGEPIPDEWEQTVAACLAKDPAQRPQSCAEVAERLGLRPPTVAYQVVTLPTMEVLAPEPPSPRPSGKGWLIGLGVAVVILVLGGLGYYFGIMLPAEKARQEQIAKKEADDEAAAAALEKQREDAVAQTEFTHTIANGQVTITKYTGSGGDVVIPDTIHDMPVTSIAQDAFADCTSLTSVLIPDSVTSIRQQSSSVFHGCTNLTAITVSAQNISYTSFDGILFDINKTALIQYPAGMANRTYTVPNSVKRIETGAFATCNNLTNVTIPNSVTSLARYSFWECSNLRNITIPDSVISIGYQAFFGCHSLTSVTIPNSATNIADSAFGDCPSLTSAVFEGNAPSMGKSVFKSTASSFTVSYPSGATGFSSPTWTDSSGDSYPATVNAQPTANPTASTPPGNIDPATLKFNYVEGESMKLQPLGYRGYGGPGVTQNSDNPNDVVLGKPIYFNQHTGNTVQYMVVSPQPVSKLSYTGVAFQDFYIQVLDLNSNANVVASTEHYNDANREKTVEMSLPKLTRFAVVIHNSIPDWLLIENLRFEADGGGVIDPQTLQFNYVEAASMKLRPIGYKGPGVPARAQNSDNPNGVILGKPVYFDQHTGTTVHYTVESPQPVTKLIYTGVAFEDFYIQVLDSNANVIASTEHFNDGNNKEKSVELALPKLTHFEVVLHNNSTTWLLIESIRFESSEAGPALILPEAPATPSVTPLPAPTPSVSARANTEAATAAGIPQAGQPWVNSLGVKFVPAGTDGVLFSVWDVRVQDFKAFVDATGYDATGGMYSVGKSGNVQQGDSWKSPGFTQTENDPVVGVSWNDAKAFCQWLTRKEQTEGRLAPNQVYRLPTDVEWSTAVGLNESGDGTPVSKEAKIRGVYPWGNEWPPPQRAGNYAGSEYDDGKWPSTQYPSIPGYNDGFPRTSPVGSFAANHYGLYDMGGNVWQWCEDKYDPAHNGRVLRGACWNSSDVSLLSSYRLSDTPGDRQVGNGFRVVLAVSAPQSGSPESAPPVSASPSAPAPTPSVSASANTEAATAAGIPQAGQPWINSLGVKFVPAGTDGVLFSVWDVRVKDYALFVNETGHDWSKPSFPQTENDPVVNMSWDDAKEFCAWLTKKEQAAGRLAASQAYRLPTDAEWSRAVGLNESNEGTPQSKENKFPGVYPWGTQWPPPSGAGNFAGEEMPNAGNREGYRDDYTTTSPVGSFAPNRYGLYDMGGNVVQKCEDHYDSTGDERTVRGASFNDFGPGRLLSSFRGHGPPDFRDPHWGFRVVVAVTASLAGSPESAPPVSASPSAPAPMPSPTASANPDATPSTDIPQAGQPWINSLGVKFVPAGTDGVLFSVWDVRVRDYELFARQTGLNWTEPHFVQSENEPVFVSWNEAKQFCDWLTKKEQTEGKLAANQSYRLPTDAEWSKAAGLNDPSEGTPSEKPVTYGVYPWGTQWPPPARTGNFFGEENVESSGQKIAGYNDGYAGASPVGIYNPNDYGLYDMAGNALQWCEDKWDTITTERVLRGSTCYSFTEYGLLSSNRHHAEPVKVNNAFRVVLAVSAPLADSPESAPPISTSSSAPASTPSLPANATSAAAPSKGIPEAAAPAPPTPTPVACIVAQSAPLEAYDSDGKLTSVTRAVVGQSYQCLRIEDGKAVLQDQDGHLFKIRADAVSQAPK